MTFTQMYILIVYRYTSTCTAIITPYSLAPSYSFMLGARGERRQFPEKYFSQIKCIVSIVALYAYTKFELIIKKIKQVASYSRVTVAIASWTNIEPHAPTKRYT